METRFVPLCDLQGLDELLARSDQGPVLLFQHDTGCPISTVAYRQMSRLGGEVPLVDVRHDHEVKHAIETRTGVKHESPQVIVLRDGEAVWSASHHAITTNAVAQALSEHL